jgi:hypothetical protein
LRGALERLELTLNEKKTSLRNARRERFDFRLSAGIRENLQMSMIQ